jgi:hypothetical protein
MVDCNEKFKETMIGDALSSFWGYVTGRTLWNMYTIMKKKYLASSGESLMCQYIILQYILDVPLCIGNNRSRR